MNLKRKHPAVRVEKALAVFNKAVDELHAAALAHHDIADEAYRQVEVLGATGAEARAAAYCAQDVAAKIAGLLS